MKETSANWVVPSCDRLCRGDASSGRTVKNKTSFSCLTMNKANTTAMAAAIVKFLENEAKQLDDDKKEGLQGITKS